MKSMIHDNEDIFKRIFKQMVQFSFLYFEGSVHEWTLITHII